MSEHGAVTKALQQAQKQNTAGEKRPTILYAQNPGQAHRFIKHLSDISKQAKYVGPPPQIQLWEDANQIHQGHEAKLYVYGHGSEGDDYLHYNGVEDSTASKIPILKIGQDVVHKGYSDVRLTSCQSGDKKKGASMGQKLSHSMAAAGGSGKVRAYYGNLVGVGETRCDLDRMLYRSDNHQYAPNEKYWGGKKPSKMKVDLPVRRGG